MKSIIRRLVFKLGAQTPSGESKDIAIAFSRKLRLLYLMACCVLIAGSAVIFALPAQAQTLSSTSVCPARPTAGSIVNNPPEIRNPDASNPANFTLLNIPPSEKNAPEQNCYLANGNVEAPTLRVSPGKKDLVLRLINRLPGKAKEKQDNNCERGEYSGGMAPQNSTNLHFHGLNVSPKCHRDEVVRTVIEPTETFKYDIEIPKDEPPGLYWYHPHVHMQSENQVLSGLTGAIIVEGIGKFNKRAAQLPERVFVLRDMDLLNPSPNDTQQPAKDISINSVPIRYKGGGNYDPPAVIQMKQNEEQFWRVANTAADTYLDLQVQYDGTAQPLKLVAMDGVPINANVQPQDQTKSVKHIMLPPAGRVEFMITGPGGDVKDAKFLTLKYDTGPEGDNDPQRTIARIDTQTQLTRNAESSTPALVSELSVDLTQVSGDRFSGLSQEKSIKERKLYFSQKDFPAPTPSDPKATRTEFYITVEPNQPKVYDPNFKTPDITVSEGTTEDWIVENRAQEVHAFHIHQIHFLVLESPDPSEIGMMRDTINVPVKTHVKLKMDFRGVSKDKNTSIAGTFVYHCHILEHEDNGMMAAIAVKS
ncbi:multicopper oxidase family protein [Brasilonema sp. CT11]|nr:multicopper oxidase family protein [Brasilonema sp. CT11]